MLIITVMLVETKLDQADSLQNQSETYTRSITANPEYEFAGIYSDQGITGYSEKRPRFQSMIDDARKGKEKWI